VLEATTPGAPAAAQRQLRNQFNFNERAAQVRSASIQRHVSDSFS
jgi:hypothetical protein